MRQDETTREQRGLHYARQMVPNLHAIPVPILSTSKGDATWKDSITKLNMFNLTEWDRLVYFDSDALIHRSPDELFDAPSTRVALPRAYWLNGVLTSTLMLIQPSSSTFDRIQAEASRSQDFDMEIVNHLFADSAMILPHRRLVLLSGELRSSDHGRYLSDEPESIWDARREVNSTAIVHFSDCPVPKPWLRDENAMLRHQPACHGRDDSDRSDDCPDRQVWWGLYDEYAREKAEVCDGQY